jgi:hypothetical protein
MPSGRIETPEYAGMTEEEKQRAYQKKCYEKHKEERQAYGRKQSKEYREKNKDRCYEAYGGYICSCPKCDETEPKFLSIDHVENNGNEHRKTIGYGNGSDIYRWLIKHDFPKEFQVLCMNCNFGKARNGGICPHLTQENSECLSQA